jgi:S-adenosylmethionine/arginine decarboxylase-like enzyme
MLPSGKIIMTDYIWSENQDITNDYLAYKVFDICERAINQTELMIVHKKLTLLPVTGYTSEPGFTLFFSLDSSHLSSHCYFDSKMIVFDVFGCGSKNDLVKVITYIEDELKKVNSSFLKTWMCSTDRFHATYRP